VLTGHVLEHGNELNVETELVDVATGAQLWGERYTRGTNDASLLQSAITRDIATQLRPQLSGNERESLARVGTKDAEAYRFYLNGRHHFEEWTPEDLKAAAQFFDKALARDPNYAAAYAGLADVYRMQHYLRFVSDPELLDKARSLRHGGLTARHSYVVISEFNLTVHFSTSAQASSPRMPECYGAIALWPRGHSGAII
jgi:hypothetical protein